MRSLTSDAPCPYRHGGPWLASASWGPSDELKLKCAPVLAVQGRSSNAGYATLIAELANNSGHLDMEG